MFENLIGIDGLIMLFVGLIVGFPYLYVFSRPKMKVKLQRIAGKRLGILRIVGEGRQCREVPFPLDATSISLGTKNFTVESGTIYDEFGKYFYWDGNIPYLDFDASDTRPLPHKANVDVKDLMSPRVMENLKIGELNTLRAVLIGAWSAILRNNVLYPLIGGIVVGVGITALLSFMNLNTSTECIELIRALPGQVNAAQTVAAAIPVA